MTIRTNQFVMLLLMALLVLPGCPADDADAQAPELSLDVRSEETYVAGQDVVRIVLTATDPQGQALTFEAVEAPERATFQTFRNQAVFNWDPIISDVTEEEPHRLVFSATNESGRTTERTVLVHIEAGQQGTRFVSSSSQLYDPTRGAPLSFEVRARNDQAPQVILAMPADTAPEGASFEQVDDFEGQFEWMPSPQQREKRIHTVVFEADDDEEVVTQEVTIIIQDPDAGGSPGGGGGGTTTECTGDIGIAHQPLSTQRTAQDFEVEGQITDSSRDWTEAVLYWTADDPLASSPDYETQSLTLGSDGNFSGKIPNPLLDSGDTAEISYTICVFDDTNDDEGVLCAPEEFLYRFLAYSPDDEKCRDDGLDNDSAAAAAPISTTDWEPHRACSESPKYHGLELADGEIVEIQVSYGAEADPAIDMSLDEASVDVEVLPCIGLAYAVVEGPGELVVAVEDDDFAYHVTGFREAAECVGAAYEPNNTPGQATVVTDDFSLYDDVAICTADDIDLYALELVQGDTLEALVEFEHDQGDLDTTLYAPSQSAEVVDGGYGVAQGWSTSDDEEISHVAEESGFYYLSVRSATTANTYELLIDRVCNDDDSFSGNDSQSAAATVGIDNYGDLKLCANEPDYFALENDGDGEPLWLGEIHPSYGSAAAIDVIVYDSGGAQVTTGEVVSGRVDFYIEPAPFETYYVAVESTQPTLYDLELEQY